MHRENVPWYWSKLHYKVGCWDDRHQPVDGRPSEENVVRGVGVDHQIFDPNSLVVLPLAEGGRKLDVAFSTDLLTREADNVVIVRYHLCLRYPYGFEGFPVENVDWTSLVHHHFHDGEFIYIDRYYHRVILLIIDTLEIIIGEGDGWHSRSEWHRIHLVHGSEVLLPDTVGASTVDESSNDGVDDFLAVSSFAFPSGVIPASTVVPSWSMLWSVVVFGPLRGVVHSLRGLVRPRRPPRAPWTKRCRCPT